MRLIFGATRNAVLSPPWATLWVLGHGGPPVTGPVERALFGALLAALGGPKQPEKAPTAMQTRRWRPAALRGYEKKPKRGASHPPFSKSTPDSNAPWPITPGQVSTCNILGHMAKAASLLDASNRPCFSPTGVLVRPCSAAR